MPRRKGPVIVAAAHLKGGVGASSVVANLGAALALRGRRTVLLDLDPLAALTFSIVEEIRGGGTLADALDGRASLAEILQDTALDALKLAPAASTLRSWDSRPERFRSAFSRVLTQTDAEGFEIALIDLPPTPGPIVRGVLAILPGGRVLAPVQGRPLDLLGLGDLVVLLDDLAAQNSQLHLAGIVPTRANRSAVCRDVLDALKAEHGRLVLPAVRESAFVARAPLRHLPAVLTNPGSAVAQDFRDLARAFVSKVVKG